MIWNHVRSRKLSLALSAALCAPPVPVARAYDAALPALAAANVPTQAFAAQQMLASLGDTEDYHALEAVSQAAQQLRARAAQSGAPVPLRFEGADFLPASEGDLPRILPNFWGALALLVRELGGAEQAARALRLEIATRSEADAAALREQAAVVLARMQREVAEAPAGATQNGADPAAWLVEALAAGLLAFVPVVRQAVRDSEGRTFDAVWSAMAEEVRGHQVSDPRRWPIEEDESVSEGSEATWATRHAAMTPEAFEREFSDLAAAGSIKFTPDSADPRSGVRQFLDALSADGDRLLLIHHLKEPLSTVALVQSAVGRDAESRPDRLERDLQLLRQAYRYKSFMRELSLRWSAAVRPEVASAASGTPNNGAERNPLGPGAPQYAQLLRTVADRVAEQLETGMIAGEIRGRLLNAWLAAPSNEAAVEGVRMVSLRALTRDSAETFLRVELPSDFDFDIFARELAGVLVGGDPAAGGAGMVMMRSSAEDDAERVESVTAMLFTRFPLLAGVLQRRGNGFLLRQFLGNPESPIHAAVEAIVAAATADRVAMAAGDVRAILAIGRAAMMHDFVPGQEDVLYGHVVGKPGVQGPLQAADVLGAYRADKRPDADRAMVRTVDDLVFAQRRSADGQPSTAYAELLDAVAAEVRVRAERIVSEGRVALNLAALLDNPTMPVQGFRAGREAAGSLLVITETAAARLGIQIPFSFDSFEFAADLRRGPLADLASAPENSESMRPGSEDYGRLLQAVAARAREQLEISLIDAALSARLLRAWLANPLNEAAVDGTRMVSVRVLALDTADLQGGMDVPDAFDWGLFAKDLAALLPEAGEGEEGAAAGNLSEPKVWGSMAGVFYALYDAQRAGSGFMTRDALAGYLAERAYKANKRRTNDPYAADTIQRDINALLGLGLIAPIDGEAGGGAYRLVADSYARAATLLGELEIYGGQRFNAAQVAEMAPRFRGILESPADGRVLQAEAMMQVMAALTQASGPESLYSEFADSLTESAIREIIKLIRDDLIALAAGQPPAQLFPLDAVRAIFSEGPPLELLDASGAERLRHVLIGAQKGTVTEMRARLVMDWLLVQLFGDHPGIAASARKDLQVVRSMLAEERAAIRSALAEHDERFGLTNLRTLDARAGNLRFQIQQAEKAVADAQTAVETAASAEVEAKAAAEEALRQAGARWTELQNARRREYELAERLAAAEREEAEVEPSIRQALELLDRKQAAPEAYAPEVRARLRASNEELGKALQYGQTLGMKELRQDVARIMTDERGVASTVEQTMILDGSQEGIAITAKLLINPGDAVVVPAPAYSGTLAVFKNYGAQFVEVDMVTEAGLDDFERRLEGGFRPKLLYAMPNFANPSGESIPEANRARLVALAEKYDFKILEDDAYYELYYDEKPPKPIRAFDTSGERVIYLGSFSKELFPGIRLGWMTAGPAFTEELREKLEKGDIRKSELIKSTENVMASGLGQLIVHKWLNSGLRGAHLDRIRNFYRSRRDALLEAVREQMPLEIGIRYTEPKGGYFVFVTLPHGMDATALLKRVAVPGGMAFVPGAPFFATEDEAFHASMGIDADGRNTLRLSFPTNDEAKIREAVAILSAALREYAAEEARMAAALTAQEEAELAAIMSEAEGASYRWVDARIYLGPQGERSVPVRVLAGPQWFPEMAHGINAKGWTGALIADESDGYLDDDTMLDLYLRGGQDLHYRLREETDVANIPMHFVNVNDAPEVRAWLSRRGAANAVFPGETAPMDPVAESARAFGEIPLSGKENLFANLAAYNLKPRGLRAARIVDGRLAPLAQGRDPFSGILAQGSVSVTALQALAAANFAGLLETLGKGVKDFGKQVDGIAVAMGVESLRMLAKALDITIIVAGNEGALRDGSAALSQGLVFNEGAANGAFLYFGDSVEVTNGLKSANGGRNRSSAMMALVPVESMSFMWDGYLASVTADTAVEDVDPVITSQEQLQSLLEKMAASKGVSLAELSREYSIFTLDRARHDAIGDYAAALGFSVVTEQDGDPVPAILRGLYGIPGPDGKKLIVLGAGGANEHRMAQIAAALKGSGLSRAAFVSHEALGIVEAHKKQTGERGSMNAARRWTGNDKKALSAVRAATLQTNELLGLNIPLIPVADDELAVPVSAAEMSENLRGQGVLSVTSITGAGVSDAGIWKGSLRPVTFNLNPDGSGSVTVSGFIVDEQGELVFWQSEFETADLLAARWRIVSSSANAAILDPSLEDKLYVNNAVMALVEGRHRYETKELSAAQYVGFLSEQLGMGDVHVSPALGEDEIEQLIGLLEHELQANLLGDPHVVNEDGSRHDVVQHAAAAEISRAQLSGAEEDAIAKAMERVYGAEHEWRPVLIESKSADGLTETIEARVLVLKGSLNTRLRWPVAAKGLSVDGTLEVWAAQLGTEPLAGDEAPRYALISEGRRTAVPPHFIDASDVPVVEEELKALYAEPGLRRLRDSIAELKAAYSDSRSNPSEDRSVDSFGTFGRALDELAAHIVLIGRHGTYRDRMSPEVYSSDIARAKENITMLLEAMREQAELAEPDSRFKSLLLEQLPELRRQVLDLPALAAAAEPPAAFEVRLPDAPAGDAFSGAETLTQAIAAAAGDPRGPEGGAPGPDGSSSAALALEPVMPEIAEIFRGLLAAQDQA